MQLFYGTETQAVFQRDILVIIGGRWVKCHHPLVIDNL